MTLGYLWHEKKIKKNRKVKIYARWIMGKELSNKLTVTHRIRWRPWRKNYNIFIKQKKVKLSKREQELVDWGSVKKEKKTIFITVNLKWRNIFVNIGEFTNKHMLTESLAKFTILRINNRIIYYVWLRLIKSVIKIFAKFDRPDLIIRLIGRRTNYRFLIRRLILYIVVTSEKLLKIVNFQRQLRNPHGYRRLKKWPRRKRRLQRRGR